MKWEMYAADYGDRFLHIGSRRYVEAHMVPEPIVPVLITEDPEGRYYGWLDFNSSGPTMIWPHRTLFDICFPYGPEAEERRGHGRIVRLSIERREEPPAEERPAAAEERPPLHHKGC